MNNKLGFKNTYKVECFREGQLVWTEERCNLVVNEGLDDVLNQYFKGVGYNAAHYCGLKSEGAISANDTLVSHAGWTELTGYDGNRVAIVLGAVAGQSVSNTANRAQFDINASATIGGVLIATVDTGTAGVLFGAVDFLAARPVLSGDTLVVTTTFTQSSL